MAIDDCAGRRAFYRDTRLLARMMNLDPHLGRRRLLVVDNDHDLVDALCEWVELNADWDAVAAYGPADAIAQAASAPPDAILLDMEMDGVDGFVTATRLELAAGTKHPPLVALTGNSALRDAAALDARFVASMLKPANLTAILNLLERALLSH
jgi:CheY-like chemotaxis protein